MTIVTVSPAANVDLCTIQEKEVLTVKGSVNLFAACSKVLCEHHDDLLGTGNLDKLIPVECFSVDTDHGSGDDAEDNLPCRRRSAEGAGCEVWT